MEWRWVGVGVGVVGVRGNLRGGGWRDSQHSFRLEPVTNRTLEVLRVKVGWVGATDWEERFTGGIMTVIWTILT